MSEGDTQTSDLTRTLTGTTPRVPRPAGARLLLSRLPVTILAIAYVIVFMVRQLPELAGVRALTQVARQASVLVWASLPGTGGAGATGNGGLFMLLAIGGAIVLGLVGVRPSIAWEPVPAVVRGLFAWLALPAAVLVVVGLVARIVAVLGQHSWSPVPVGGVAFGLLAAAIAIFAIREIVLAADPAASSARGAGPASAAGSTRVVTSDDGFIDRDLWCFDGTISRAHVSAAGAEKKSRPQAAAGRRLSGASQGA